MKNLIYIISLVTTVVLLSCNYAPKINLDDELQTLRRTDKNWSDAYASKDAKHYLDFFDKDGIVIDFTGQITQDKDSILRSTNAEFQTPGNSGSWHTQDAAVAKAGDLGYTKGEWEMQWTSNKGEQMKEHGPYLVIWKKQVDGTWKAIVDSFWKAK
jgi:uncharacterized protein (TIGR02246 family)